MRRHELTDEQREKIAPFVPPQRPATGRPAKDHRTIINGILWFLKTGVPWRDLPERFGAWQTVYSRFRRWRQSGIWERILAAVQCDGVIDWSVHFVDGTSVRAHQHAAGAKGGRVSKRSVEVEEASRPRFICGLTDVDGPSPLLLPQASGMKRPNLHP